MDFSISGLHDHSVYLVCVGFIIGVLGGFFGVGGSFLAGPALRLIGMPWNFAVGTDLAHIVGKSVVAAREHQRLGNIDLKLGLIMACGTIPGAEVGAQAIELLKRHGILNSVVSFVSIGVYSIVAVSMASETILTLRNHKAMMGNSGKVDENSYSAMTRWLQHCRFPPTISFPKAGIERISLWIILLTAFFGGILSGFLGGGAGYIRLPFMVYLLGVPTHLAVGTDLFEIIISASYATLSHAMKGNVDILVALMMHTGAAIGAQFGALLTQFFNGPRIRMAFVPLPIVGAVIVVYTLLTGKKD